MRYRSILAFLLLGLAPSLDAQRLVPTSNFLLNLDYSRFRYDDSTGYFELYYAFYPKLVTCDPVGDGTYKGWVNLSVMIRDKQTGAPQVHEKNVMPILLKDTARTSASMTMVSQTSYRLPFGEYTLNVVATDSLSPQRCDSLALPLVMPSVNGRTLVSDLELCSRITEEATTGPFVKNTLEVVPNPSLVFGAAGNPVVFHYAELYNLVPSTRYVLTTSISDARGTLLRQASRSRTFSIPHAVDVGTTNVTMLTSGRYTFTLRLLQDSTVEVARSSKPFYVFNPQIQAPVASTTSMKAGEMAGLTFEELGAEFASAKYLATDTEIEGFQKLGTAEARREFLAGFWASVERGRPGHDPITRLEYQGRVKVADQKYRVHSREGWRSDRGRVFILYGEPDEVERQPSSEGSKPYEIWHFYKIENGVLFIFVDRTGFGDYVLVHSTKRGELQDDSWERQLH